MTRHVQVRLEEAEYETFRAKAQAAGFKSVQEACRHILLNSLEENGGSGLEEKHRPYIKKLTKVLASGNRLAIEAVTRNLDVFVRFVDQETPRTRR